MSRRILVISPDDRELVLRRYSANLMFLGVKVVDGGAERFQSVANALAQVKPEADFVAVHDAVRPCTPAALIEAVFAAAVKHGAAVPGLAVADTLKRVDNQMMVTQTVPRMGLWQAQTPQVFRKDWLVEAYERTGAMKDVTDDAQLVEAAGHPVRVLPGSPFNLKITTHDDLKIAMPVPQAAGGGGQAEGQPPIRGRAVPVTAFNSLQTHTPPCNDTPVRATTLQRPGSRAGPKWARKIPNLCQQITSAS